MLYSKLFRNAKNPFLSPFLFSVASIIAILIIFKIPLEYYNRGGDIIKFFLGPTTVALSINLYKKIELLKRHFLPIIVGIFVGATVAILSAYGIGKLFGLNKQILISMLPKSTTTAIATELSKTYAGIVPMTLFFVLIAGYTGYIFSEFIFKILKIGSNTAKGIAIGTASHSIGTTKAIEMGPEIAAMSTLSIALAGIVTGIVLPILFKFLF